VNPYASFTRAWSTERERYWFQKNSYVMMDCGEWVGVCVCVDVFVCTSASMGFLVTCLSLYCSSFNFFLSLTSFCDGEETEWRQ
jgi:hypothetical protein